MHGAAVPSICPRNDCPRNNGPLLMAVRKSEEYEGFYWRVYDTHFQNNVEAKSWSKMDHDLYGRVFTGRVNCTKIPVEHVTACGIPGPGHGVN